MALLPEHDAKRAQSFVQGLLIGIIDLEKSDTYLQLLLAEWNAKNPGLSGVLTGPQATQANLMIQAINDVVTDYSSIIAILKSIDIPSHRTASLFAD